MKKGGAIPEQKECSCCHQTKPAIAFAAARNGLRAMCRVCQNARKTSRRAAPKVDPTVDEGAINEAFRRWFGWVRKTPLRQEV